MRSVRWRGRATVAGGLLVAAGVGAPSARAETLADAIALAYQANPTLQQQRAQLRALDETYVQARAGWRPTASAQVTGSYSKTPQVGFAGRTQVESNSGVVVVGLTQPIYTGGRTATQVRAAEADVLAARQALLATEQNLLEQVVIVYADVLRDQALLSIRENDVAVLQGEVDDADARFRAGEVTATDVAQTETQRAQSRSALTTAQGQLQLARAAYASLVGQNPGELAPPPSMPGLPADADEAFAVAELENPTLRQAEIAEEASRARIAEARAANRPTLSVNASLGYTGALTPIYGRDYDREVNAVATLTQPLFTGGVNASNIRRAVELNTSDRIGIEGARRAAVQTVSQSWNQLITTRATIIAEEDHVRTARNYFSGTQAEYTVGQRSTLDVIIAEQSLVGAELNVTVARHDAFIAQAALLSGMGRLQLRYVVPEAPIYDPAVSFRRVAHDGAVPWEGVVAALDNLGAPGPGGRRPIPAPAVAIAPTIAASTDPLGPQPAPAVASPTAPVLNTTSPATPETLGALVAPPEDAAIPHRSPP